jgi:predicted nucleic acid-binding protein
VIVVDASVAVKWFLDELHSDQAAEVLSVNAGQLYVPDIMLIEVTSALVRNANMVKSSRPNILIALNRFEKMLGDGDIMARRSSGIAIRQSADVAIKLGHPLKGCIYLALAMELACPLITADIRFADKVREVYKGIRILGE